ncbi:hypothetical protein V8C86DRAFT_3023705 [Haematococcus lacustris]
MAAGEGGVAAAGSEMTVAAQPCQYPDNASVPFQRLVVWFQKMSGRAGKCYSWAQKQRLLEEFMARYLNRRSHDTFQIMRLLCPERDRVRGNFRLLATALARVLILACNVSKDSEEGQALLNWRTQQGQSVGPSFLDACYQHLLVKYCCVQPDDADRRGLLTVGQLNAALDELADPAKGSMEYKADVVRRRLLTCTTALQMRWIICIILKDLNLGKGEESIIKAYHPDAFDLFSLSQDLHLVCKQLLDPSQRMQCKDVEPGLAIKPMLATACFSVVEAFNGMKGQPFLVELKFDGERILLHCQQGAGEGGTDLVKYTSRRGHEHGMKSEYSVLDACVRAQLEPGDVIVDGELVVWNKAIRQFEPFGTLKGSVNAARGGQPAGTVLAVEGLARVGLEDCPAPEVQDLEDPGGVVYVAFDLLYCQGRSLTHLPLKERLRQLEARVRPAPPEGFTIGAPGSAVRGRIALLLPGRPLLPGLPPCSCASTTQEDIQAMYDRALANNEEGLVVKRLDSQWQYGVRSEAWLKLKPDYVVVQDLDAVIIGAFYGERSTHTAVLHQFLLALPVEPPGGGQPWQYESFCKVSTGLSEAVRADLLQRLVQAGLRRSSEPGSKPGCYIHPKEGEEPHVWVQDVNKSVVLELRADIRTINSRQFACRHSLRFPRILRWRPDKTAAQCNKAADIDHRLRSLRTAAAAGGAPGAIRPGGNHWARASVAADGARIDAATSQAALRRMARQDQQAKARARGGGWSGHRGGAGAGRGVPTAFRPPDLAGVTQEQDILAGRRVVLLGQSFGPGHTRESLSQLARQLGAEVWQQRAHEDDLVLALDVGEGLRRELERDARFDVLRISWLLECKALQQWVQPRPWHYLFMRPTTRMDADDHDQCGAPWFRSLDAEGLDMKQIMDRLMDRHQLAQVEAELRLADSLAAAKQHALLVRGESAGERLPVEGSAESGGPARLRSAASDAIVTGMRPVTGRTVPQVPRSLLGIMSDVRRRLAGVGVTLTATSLFLGKVVFILDMGPCPPHHSPIPPPQGWLLDPQPLPPQLKLEPTATLPPMQLLRSCPRLEAAGSVPASTGQFEQTVSSGVESHKGDHAKAGQGRGAHTVASSRGCGGYTNQGTSVSVSSISKHWGAGVDGGEVVSAALVLRGSRNPTAGGVAGGRGSGTRLDTTDDDEVEDVPVSQPRRRNLAASWQGGPARSAGRPARSVLVLEPSSPTGVSMSTSRVTTPQSDARTRRSPGSTLSGAGTPTKPAAGRQASLSRTAGLDGGLSASVSPVEGGRYPTLSFAVSRPGAGGRGEEAGPSRAVAQNLKRRLELGEGEVATRKARVDAYGQEGATDLTASPVPQAVQPSRFLADLLSDLTDDGPAHPASPGVSGPARGTVVQAVGAAASPHPTRIANVTQQRPSSLLNMLDSFADDDNATSDGTQTVHASATTEAKRNMAATAPLAQASMPLEPPAAAAPSAPPVAPHYNDVGFPLNTAAPVPSKQPGAVTGKRKSIWDEINRLS